jgi:hypothetical protein
MTRVDWLRKEDLAWRGEGVGVYCFDVDVDATLWRLSLVLSIFFFFFLFCRHQSSSMPSPGNTSTMSSFQPEFESTQQFDTATQLPSTAQRFNHYQPQAQTHHTDVDSFADFTQKSPSPSPSPSREASMSIEAGRGKKSSPKPLDLSDLPLPSDSLYDMHSTPPRSTRPTPRKTESLRKEASLRRAHSSDKRANASQRRSLSDMHHKVHRESDSSFVGDTRPSTHINQPRNTRFTSAQLPSSYSHDQGLQSATTPQRPLSNATATWSANQTQASFMLPDLPNITELVSGVRKDGTPVFSRSATSRSRFTSASYNNNNTITHANINSIAVPDEEKAIFASLQLLKDKVATLESEKSEALKRLQEYESEVTQLKSYLDVEQKMRRPDSALGEDDDNSAKERWRVERATLKSTVKALQGRLDRGERKLSVNDIAVKRLIQERDDLVTQLGVAYYNSEEFKSENMQLRASNEHLEADVEALQAENARLRARLGQIKAHFNEETQQWTFKTQSREAIAQPTRPQDQTLAQMSQHSTKKQSSNSRLGQDTKHNILDSIENEIKRSRSTATSANVRSHSRSKSTHRQTISKPQRYAYVNDADSTTNLDLSRPNHNHTVEDDEDSRDITYLSLLDPKELAKLRKTLEEERRALRTASVAPAQKGSAPAAPAVPAQKRSAPAAPAVPAAPAQKNATLTNVTAAPRKSSLKDMTSHETGQFTIRSQVEEHTGLLKNVRIQSPHTSDAISYSEPKECTEASFMSTTSRRQRGKSFEEMTSAFILPDITLHTGRGAAATTSTADAVSHDAQDCTFCPAEESRDKDITIPMPVPVSDRDIDDTNATIRPSQPPPVALATVLKQLEDEVKHLKLQLATYERLYNQHDPALGRRKRRAVKDKIDVLIGEIERRSDQVYALYDVLEGQKMEEQNNDEEEQEMDGEQVEETLQSLGIDMDELAQRAREAKQMQQHHPLGLNGLLADDSEDEIPWGGFSDESDMEEVQLPRRRSGGNVVSA